MMKRLKTIDLRYILTSLAFIVLFITASAQERVNIDKIIAKVDDYIVLKSDLEKGYLEFLSRGEFRGANAKCQVLEQLVVNKMLVAKSIIDSVEVSDDEVKSNLSRRMEYMVSQVGSPDEIEKFYGKTLDQLEDELFESIKEQMIIQRMQQEITSNLKVSPSEVRKFYNKIPRDSLPYFSTEVQVGQIVVIPEAGKSQINKVKKEMYELRGRIIKGESFSTIARQYSDDPGSAPRGGQLPFFKRGDLAPEYEATAMTLQPGELSMPVQSDFGVHLIELQEKRGNTFRSRHILKTPKPSLDDVQEAENFLDSLRTLILNDSIDFQAAAKEHSDDKSTSSNGGFFLDENGSARISVEELDPTIFFTLDTMKIGNITRPERFQQQDGSYAFRILYYKYKVPPHQANLKIDYQKIAAATLNDKRNRILSKWFEDARKNVFIDIDPAYKFCNLLE